MSNDNLSKALRYGMDYGLRIIVFMDHLNQPDRPLKSFRVTLTLTAPKPRLDQVLLEALRKQSQNLLLKNISRTEFKELFKKKKIRIKGQAATPSSALAQGTTFVDVLGFDDKA